MSEKSAMPNRHQINKHWAVRDIIVDEPDGPKVLGVYPFTPIRKPLNSLYLPGQPSAWVQCLRKTAGAAPKGVCATFGPSGSVRIQWVELGMSPPSSDWDAGKAKSVITRYIIQNVLKPLGKQTIKKLGTLVFGFDIEGGTPWVEAQYIVIVNPHGKIGLTSKFHKPAGQTGWSMAWVHNLSLHVQNIQGIGRSLFLNCHDLVALSGRSKKTLYDQDLKRRRQEILALSKKLNPFRLVHLYHYEENKTTWGNKISELVNSNHPPIAYISCGRITDAKYYKIWKKRAICRGFSLTRVVVSQTR